MEFSIYKPALFWHNLIFIFDMKLSTVWPKVLAEIILNRNHYTNFAVLFRHFHVFFRFIQIGGTPKAHILFLVYSFFSKWKVAKHKKRLLVDFCSSEKQKHNRSPKCRQFSLSGLDVRRHWTGQEVQCLLLHECRKQKDKKLYTLQNTIACV